MLTKYVPKSFGELRDQKAIDTILSTYAWAMDTRDWTLYRSLFADTLHLSFPEWIGVAEGEQSSDVWAASCEVVATGFAGQQHLITNRLIELNGDSATASAYLLNINHFRAEDMDGYTRLGGFYRMGLVRRDGSWKISAIRLDIAWDEGDRGLYGLAYQRGRALLARKG